MSRRCGSSRTIGEIKQCAIYVRGGMRCAWCCIELTTSREATIDHLDGDIRNNDPLNLVPACVGCNSCRAWNWIAGVPWSPAAQRDASFDFCSYLERKEILLADAIRRVSLQRRRALDRVAGRALAHRWHGDRLRKRSMAATVRKRAWREEQRVLARARGDTRHLPGG